MDWHTVPAKHRQCAMITTSGTEALHLESEAPQRTEWMALARLHS